MILVLDNRDSYTYNLVQLLRRDGREVCVVGADAGDEALELLASGAVSGVVISPGPGHPDEPDDFAASGALIDAVLALATPEHPRRRIVPLLGVCLGHQGLARRFGYEVVPASEPRHGWLSPLEHTGAGLFDGVPQGTRVTRYHSLHIVPGESPDPALRVTARSEDGVIQAFEIEGRPWFGVQFHPESIASEHGADMVAAFARLADDASIAVPSGVSHADSSGVSRSDSSGAASGGVSDAPGHDPGSSGGGEVVAERGVDTLHVAVHAIELEPGVRPTDAARALATHWARRGRGSFWLDSALADADGTHWSLVGDANDAAHDGEAAVLRFREGRIDVDRWPAAEMTPAGESETVAQGEVIARTSQSCHVFAALDTLHSGVRVEGGEGLPFRGGLVGFLGYELGLRDLGVAPERIHAAATPDAAWVRPSRFAVVDHVANRVEVAVVSRDRQRAAEAAVRERAAAVAALRRGAATARADGLSGVPRARELPGVPRARERAGVAGLVGGAVAPVPGRWRDDRATYAAKIEACRAALRAGDSYELCLTNEFEVDEGVEVDPLDLFDDLIRNHPTPYAALFELDDGGEPLAIVSASPERFLRGRAAHPGTPSSGEGATAGDGRAKPDLGSASGGVYETKPIKGTARRDPDPGVDRAIAEALATDPKTFAENLMIVDLLRNDLGRVCVPGTVEVPELMRVESYASVHQLVSTIRGVAEPGVRPVEVVRALFPGGSMTGAPKRRSVELLADLEQRARGVYSGALGFLGADGRTELSIVIRTAVLAGGRWTIGAGGAIVLDSEAEAETDEVELKASAMRQAIARVARTARAVPAGSDAHSIA